MKKVDCLIISTGRAASTAIYQYLDQTADLALPKNKEPHYWCNVKEYEELGELLLDIYIEDETDYFNLFKNSKIHLDASVGYFFCIDEVVDKLKTADQKPKIIFLYREPVSRARSLFYEEKKKGLVKTNNVLSEVLTNKQKGLWWEHYYDNVAYFTVFKVLEHNFDNILCINQAALHECGNFVVEEILAFIEIEKKHKIQLTPINSSAQAAVKTKFRWLKKISGLPIPFKVMINEKLIGLADRKIKENSFNEMEKLEECLPFSLGEYRRFREYINYIDILLINSRKGFVARDCE